MYKDNPYILNFEFVHDGLVSTNEAYFHMPKKSKKSNRMTTYAVRSDKLKKLQDDLDEMLNHLISDEYIKIVSDLVDTKFYGLKIVTLYYMPYENYRDSDVSNYIKNYEDCIATRLRKFNKNLDDKNNLEYRAIKRYRHSGSTEWKIRTVIYPIERDIKYRSEILKLYCSECNEYHHCSYDKHTLRIYCDCDKHPDKRVYIGLDLNRDKSLYGITKTYNENQCSVCGSEINEEGICTYCGINKLQYNDLINNFNEESLDYEE